MLRPLGSSPSQATAFHFLWFLFISKAVNSAFFFFFSFLLALFSDIFYSMEIRWQSELQMELNWVIHYARLLCFPYLKSGNNFSVDNLSLMQPFLVLPFFVYLINRDQACRIEHPSYPCLTLYGDLLVSLPMIPYLLHHWTSLCYPVIFVLNTWDGITDKLICLLCMFFVPITHWSWEWVALL